MYYRTISLIGIILLICLNGFSKELKYPFAEIPTHLLNNAQVVVRESSEHLSIKNNRDAVLKVKKVYTVINENGDNDVNLMLTYDKFRRIRDISGTIYDAAGKKLDKIRSENISDYSAISGYSVFDDNRVKYYNPQEYPYPYTVEYNYEIKLEEFFSYPGWNPINNYYMAVQNSEYSAYVADGMTFKYQEFNLPSTCKKTKVEGGTTYLWQAQNLEVIKPEAYSPNAISFFPHLLAAPEKFEMEGYEGNLNSWSEFANWISQLNEGRDELPEESVNQLKELTKEAKSDKEKIAILYKHLQQNCRYVSIQVGIGGWQPMAASDVEKWAYGDCKALTNYMQAMLKAVNIKSFYSLVKAGSSANPIAEDFVSAQFNHAILCVPMGNDTTWLECTSQDTPAGFIGKFTDNRTVLLIKPHGGELIQTKAYTKNDNKKITLANIQLVPNGESKASIKTTYNGVYFNNLIALINEDEKDKEKKMYNKFNLPGYSINSFSHKVKYTEIPVVEELVEMNLKNAATVFGNRLIFCPNLLSNNFSNIDQKEERKTDIDLRREYLDIDSLTFEIPLGYKLSSPFKKQEFETDFGSYFCEFIQNSNKLTYVRKVEYKNGLFPKERYTEFASFIADIIKADNSKVALIKN